MEGSDEKQPINQPETVIVNEAPTDKPNGSFFDNIPTSATRMVLLWFAIWLPILTWVGIISGEQFINLVVMVFSSFFAAKATADAIERGDGMGGK